MPSDDDECAICLGRVTEKRKKTLACGHAFHAACIRRWFSKSLQCPCCRRGSLEAVRECVKSAKIHLSFKRVLERAPFPECMSDADRIRDVVGCGAVMTELGVKFEDRAFMMLLADVANDAKHFLDMLRRLSSYFEQSSCDSAIASSLKSPEDEPRIAREDRSCT
jgi:hypothetical protein